MFQVILDQVLGEDSAHVFFSECCSFARGKSRHLTMKKSFFFSCFGMCVLCVEERDIFHSVASYKGVTAGI